MSRYSACEKDKSEEKQPVVDTCLVEKRPGRCRSVAQWIVVGPLVLYVATCTLAYGAETAEGEVPRHRASNRLDGESSSSAQVTSEQQKQLARLRRDYRIQLYETFRQNRSEYLKRRAAGEQTYQRWVAAGERVEQYRLLTVWYRKARLHSLPGRVRKLPAAPRWGELSRDVDATADKSTERESAQQDILQRSPAQPVSPPEQKLADDLNIRELNRTMDQGQSQPKVVHAQSSPSRRVPDPRELKQQKIAGPPFSEDKVSLPHSAARPLASAADRAMSPGPQRNLLEKRRTDLGPRILPADEVLKVDENYPRQHTWFSQVGPLKRASELERPFVSAPQRKASRSGHFHLPLPRESVVIRVPKREASVETIPVASELSASIPVEGDKTVLEQFEEIQNEPTINTIELAAQLTGYNQKIRQLENELLLGQDKRARTIALHVTTLENVYDRHADLQAYLALVSGQQRSVLPELADWHQTVLLCRNSVRKLRSNVSGSLFSGTPVERQEALDILDALDRRLELMQARK